MILSKVWTNIYYGIHATAFHDNKPRACYACFDAQVPMVWNDLTITSLYESREADKSLLVIFDIISTSICLPEVLIIGQQNIQNQLMNKKNTMSGANDNVQDKTEYTKPILDIFGYSSNKVSNGPRHTLTDCFSLQICDSTAFPSNFPSKRNVSFV